MKYTIFGKSTNTISLLADIMAESNKTYNEILVVKNIQVTDKSDYKFKNSNLCKFKKSIHINDWIDDKSKVLMGALRVPTKLSVYKSFLKIHKFHKRYYSTLQHPNSIISKQTKIGAGTMIGPGTIISPFTKIGYLVSLSRGAIISHHTKIGDFCTLNPGCKIAGGVKIGERTTIGIGAIILDDVEIGENTIVGAGSLVTKSIPSNVIAYGSPAKIIRSNPI